MNYEVKVTQSGRGGVIYYSENGKKLPFDWEFAINGALLFAPSPAHWNYFCDKNNLPEAQNRRDKILTRICEEVICQQTSGAEYEIGDDYISITFRAG